MTVATLDYNEGNVTSVANAVRKLGFDAAPTHLRAVAAPTPAV